ncbi:hypothetical protein CTI12_AA079610 [Artemisia annua]|uniref:Defective in cullin neddylation protein n=1 Tax=Artemisia annua TaxID=35608 RepID=A0A2U1NU57_ARTAN|nr:hypothetical protein CTI12_AA079610 [Artemisia annua]
MSFRVRAVKQKDSHINLKVVSQMNELDPYFRVRRDEPLKQLMIRWSVRANVGDYRAIRFFFDGMRVNKDKTPNDMELEDVAAGRRLCRLHRKYVLPPLNYWYLIPSSSCSKFGASSDGKEVGFGGETRPRLKGQIDSSKSDKCLEPFYLFRGSLALFCESSCVLWNDHNQVLGFCIVPLNFGFLVPSANQICATELSPLSFRTADRRMSILEEVVVLMSRLNLQAYINEFSRFYDFVFFICRENGQRSITVSRAIMAWKLVLSGRFRLFNQWCIFVEARLHPCRCGKMNGLGELGLKQVVLMKVEAVNMKEVFQVAVVQKLVRAVMEMKVVPDIIVGFGGETRPRLKGQIDSSKSDKCLEPFYLFRGSLALFSESSCVLWNDHNQVLGFCIVPLNFGFLVPSANQICATELSPLSFRTADRRMSILEEVVVLMSRLNLQAYINEFSRFYDFVFFICRENGQRSITVSRAIMAWKLVLSGRFRFFNQWCIFVEER